MDPIRTPTSNLVYKGDGGEIADLHCERRRVDGGHTAIFSTWKPTDEERAWIAAGANVEIGIYHVEPIPPISVTATMAGYENTEQHPGITNN